MQRLGNWLGGPGEGWGSLEGAAPPVDKVAMGPSDPLTWMGVQVGILSWLTLILATAAAFLLTEAGVPTGPRTPPPPPTPPPVPIPHPCPHNAGRTRGEQSQALPSGPSSLPGLTSALLATGISGHYQPSPSPSPGNSPPPPPAGSQERPCC